ncbi:hypothetical protein TRIUR3_33618 [Triticum urartu]|uniref:Uncharacterized protein n=1 Tax=Triticum urartu TaxID=4572 RepID=M8A3G7_TRIUA|nr:hypothetical protein TRIUR3_33618 [Triticum urartu]
MGPQGNRTRGSCGGERLQQVVRVARRVAFGSDAGVAGAQGEEPCRVGGFAGAGSRAYFLQNESGRSSPAQRLPGPAGNASGEGRGMEDAGRRQAGETGDRGLGHCEGDRREGKGDRARSGHLLAALEGGPGGAHRRNACQGQRATRAERGEAWRMRGEGRQERQGIEDWGTAREIEEREKGIERGAAISWRRWREDEGRDRAGESVGLEPVRAGLRGARKLGRPGGLRGGWEAQKITKKKKRRKEELGIGLGHMDNIPDLQKYEEFDKMA